MSIESSANKDWEEASEGGRLTADNNQGRLTRLKPTPLTLPTMNEDRFSGFDHVICVNRKNTHLPLCDDDYLTNQGTDLFRYDEFSTDLRNGRESSSSDGFQNYTYSTGPSTWSSNLRNSGSSGSPINGFLEETSSQDSSCAGSSRGATSYNALRNAEIASALHPVGSTNPGYFGGRALLMSPPCDTAPSLASTTMLAQTREEKLLELTNKTGYNIVQRNGQMIYGGPPPNWYGPPPCKGSEVFVGKVPRDIFEDELVPIFERVGKIYELRLMMDFSGSNRGYFFVRYTCKEDAKRAVRELNNYEIRPNKQLGVIHSVDNRKLWISGIPQNRSPAEIQADMERLTDGVRGVILYSSQQDKSKSRGYAFVEYESHRAAALARRKLVPGRIFLCGQEIEKVDWAEPENEVDEETMAKVRVLFLRNLMTSTTEHRIRQIFNYLSGEQVERVKKAKDFAFVHFMTREAAESAKVQANNLNLTIDGSRVEVTWSKPVNKGLLTQKRPLSHGFNSPISHDYQDRSGFRANTLTALDFNPLPNFQEPPPTFINHRGHNIVGQNTNMFSPGSARKLPGGNHGNGFSLEQQYMSQHSLLTEQFLQTLQELKLHGNINPTLLPTNYTNSYHQQNLVNPFAFYGQASKGPTFTENDQMVADLMEGNPFSIPPPDNYITGPHPVSMESNVEMSAINQAPNSYMNSSPVGFPSSQSNHCGQAFTTQNLISSSEAAPNIE